MRIASVDNHSFQLPDANMLPPLADVMLRTDKLSSTRLSESNYHQNLKVTKPQLTFTCSNSAIETLEKGTKYVQS